jgi:preprotein translocase subunit SecA
MEKPMSVLSTLVKKIIGDPQKKLLKAYAPHIKKINDFEETLLSLSDEDLKQKTISFKNRIAEGTALDTLLPEAFAVVREASKRVLGMRHFDVQLIGGMILHDGSIAEMKTGEGKTLMSTLPAYLNALEGKGVYVVTVNDYLAKRDSEWMGKIHTFLGLEVGLIQSGMNPADKLNAYSKDITYGTNNEFGFDYLRDNLSWDIKQCCQTRRHFAIIDEVDSILIDEARTPLIISGPTQESTEKYVEIAKSIKKLDKDTHFTIEEKQKNIILTEDGIDKVEEVLNLTDLYSVENMDMAHRIIQCLRAKYLFNKDVDYVVKNNEIIIVDEFTGRLMDGRRYSDGLHQAIEAIECVKVQEESQTLASITFQNYFRMFPKLSGMTGTALTEAAEFESIYSLGVTQIPTNKPNVRDDKADLIYKTSTEKYKAIAEDVAEAHKKNQPVLLGTISIEISEYLGSLLTKKGIKHNVLNAKQHEREAEIIANAGNAGSVTIATNMAGRGTDIVLGEGVKEAGGLFVVGSERHESRRIDNQLRGRSGRQGDPGQTRFYVSLDDELMRLFGSERIKKVMETLGLPEDTPIEHPLISRSIEKAQEKVEKHHFSTRKHILKYDDVLNRQRETIYSIRQKVLGETELDPLMKELLLDLVKRIFRPLQEKMLQNEAVLTDLAEELKKFFPIDNIDSFFKSLTKEKNRVEKISNYFYEFYLSRKNTDIPSDLFDSIITRRVLLQTLDRKWMDHLKNMDLLREGIGLRAWGQRDPLIEYKKEGFDMFNDLLYNIYTESFSIINRAVIITEDIKKDRVKPKQPKFEENKKKELPTPVQNSETIGRNDLCTCGSGKKYKKCCMN